MGVETQEKLEMLMMVSVVVHNNCAYLTYTIYRLRCKPMRGLVLDGCGGTKNSRRGGVLGE